MQAQSMMQKHVPPLPPPHPQQKIAEALDLELAAGPSGALILLFEMAQNRDSRRSF